MSEARKIYCPKCKRRVMYHDGKSEINKVVRCKNCRKYVLFNTITGEVKNVPAPERACASGKRYY